MEFDTKFKIGDQVRTIETYHYSRSIPCPFCSGNGHVMDGENILECEMCEDGIYTYDTPEKVWGRTLDVVGATIQPRFEYVNNKFKRIDEIQICVADNKYSPYRIKTIPEDELIFANEAEEGDPVRC